MNIKDSDKSVGINAIELLQRMLDKKLPKDYLDFLLEYNGGYPEPDCFLFATGKEGSSVQGFYKINSQNDFDDLIKIIKTYENRIPEDFIPFAYDPGGNQVCIAVSGKQYGKIYFWDHETEEDNINSSISKNMSLVSNSFTDFMNALCKL